MQETQVWSLIWGDLTCPGAARPVLHDYWACALEVESQALGPRAAATAAQALRAQAPQQEKPPQLGKARATAETQHSQK